MNTEANQFIEQGSQNQRIPALWVVGDTYNLLRRQLFAETMQIFCNKFPTLRTVERFEMEDRIFPAAECLHRRIVFEGREKHFASHWHGGQPVQ